MSNEVVTAQPKFIELDSRPSAANAVVAIEQGRAMQEATASLLIAQRCPRDEVAAYKRIMNACTRLGLAEAAIYDYVIGGAKVTGPSIRLAEVLKQCWGNIDSGWRELDRRGNVSTIQTFAWDKETNTRALREITVTHLRDKWEEKIIDGKKAKIKVKAPIEDENMIYLNNANVAAKRMRACILELIPPDIKEDAVEACKKTLADKSPNTPEIRDNMIKVFKDNHGVNRKMLEAFIQRSMDALTGGQLVTLRSIYNSLQEEMSEAKDWFDTDLADKKEEPKPEPEKNPEATAAKTDLEKKTLDSLKEKAAANAKANEENKQPAK